MHSRTLACLLVILCLASLAAEEKKLVDVADYFTQAFLTDCELSPDGRQVAYVELRWEPPKESRNGDIWLADTSTNRVRRLTFDSASDGSPHWSPDSRFLYFTSGRKQGDGSVPPYNGKTQVWRIDVASGHITPITRLAGGVAGYQLSGNGKMLYYKVAQKSQEDEWKALRAKHPKLKYGRGANNVSELWKLDLETWRATKVVAKKRFIREFAVSPDERYVSMITTRDDRLITHEGWSRVDVLDSKTAKITTLPDKLWRKDAPAPHGWLEQLAWSPDSTRLAFRVAFDGYPAEMFCAHAASNRVGKIKRPGGVTIYGGAIHWQGNHVCFQGQSRARERVYRIEQVHPDKQGPSSELTSGDVVVAAFSVASNGRQLSVIKSDPRSGRDLFLVSSAQPTRYRQLTESNPQMKQWKLPQISVVRWRGANNDWVEGILELPPDYDRSKGKLATIVHIHGGPTAATPFAFRFWPYGRTLLPSKGYALLSPNYHGSTGYGDKFMTDLVGRENEIEVEDINKGVDWLIKQGIADPKRLGVMGWSNGGFLTNAMITKTNRFRAASSGAGVIDQVMQWGLEDTPGHVINFMSGALPWQNPIGYGKGSPLFGLGKVTTPTLIHVGENDARVPAAHSRTLFRALHHYRKVPTQLVVYPGAGHSPLTYSYRKAKMAWDLAWFERYLKK